MPYNYFPQTYQPIQPIQPMYQQQPAQSPRMVEAVPVDSVDEAAKIQVQIGGTVLAFARDDSFIAVKSVGVNGQDSFNIFDKRPPAPPKPAFNPEEYVTKEELETRLAAILKPEKKKGEATA